jgi:urea carboxylase
VIYDEPRFLPGGDRYLLIEFGDEMNLELNFTAQSLAAAIEDNRLKGVIETAPCFATLLVHYDPDRVGYDELVRELGGLIEQLGPAEEHDVTSRLFLFETLYLDPWTRECIDRYRKEVTEKEPDPEFITRLNGLTDVDQLVRVHSATEYWSCALGFYPGVSFMMPLDPRARMTAPKYNPPRTWRPQGAVGMGGSCTCIYPAATPGGYQLFGRTPVPIWDIQHRFDIFGDNVVLFRAGDRVRFLPVTREEYDAAEARVAEGSYVYNVIEYQKFSLRDYKNWCASIDVDKKF